MHNRTNRITILTVLSIRQAVNLPFFLMYRMALLLIGVDYEFVVLKNKLRDLQEKQFCIGRNGP